ncbi:hypothetical protein [Sphingomicrobium sediminis]|uniref:Lipoprotein n=1 Tax=Sphingomicrobium sediminis TaxID=2950949 RepID=A0A9X2EHB2_9SPHN|nr:hypothetical protein [Sphingomicrobium sediminis]MCM8558015.1 hypothetical protein [Sphingomicrobium sediminis]
MTTLSRTAPALLAAAMLGLSACSAPAEEEAANEEAVVEEMDEAEDETEAVAEGEGEAIEICDEDGNRYASEDEAADAGLEPAQYGATYCQYFEE